MADIALISASTRSLTCQATDLPSGATFIRWYIGLTESDMPYNGYCSTADTDWPKYTFTWWGDEDEPDTIQNLQPDTEYLVKISVRDANQNAIGSAVTRYFTTAANVRPSNWSWESTVSKGAAINLTAAEWNRFIDRIFAFAAYVGLSPAVTPDTYYVEQGTEMLASQFNSARAMVNAMSPPTAAPSPVSPDSTITAAAINGLKNSLNSIA